jgi:hypothetical protein
MMKAPWVRLLYHMDTDEYEVIKTRSVRMEDVGLDFRVTVLEE